MGLRTFGIGSQLCNTVPDSCISAASGFATAFAVVARVAAAEQESENIMHNQELMPKALNFWKNKNLGE